MAYVSTAESRCGTGMELFTVYFFVGSALAIIDLSHLIVTPWTREMAVRRLILTVFVGTWVAIHHATYR